MYRLFTNIVDIKNGALIPNNWNYIDNQLKENIRKVIQYYRSNISVSNNENILVKLIHRLNIPMDMPIERYVSIVDDMSLEAGMSLGMTSPIYQGSVKTSQFFGDNNNEIIIADNGSFNINYVLSNWRKIRSINVIRHPFSNLNCNHPNGNVKNPESGICIIHINIPLLMLQYRCFCEAEKSRSNPKNYLHFISMIIMSNMIPSILDYSMLNRFKNKVLGFENKDSLFKHNFYLNTQQNRVDEIYDEVIKRITNNSTLDIFNTLKNIPVAFHGNALSTLSLPVITPTRQVNWALSISRLDIVCLLFKLQQKTKSMMNKSTINLLLRILEEYRTGNVYRNVLGQHIVRIEVENKIKEIKSIVTRL